MAETVFRRQVRMTNTISRLIIFISLAAVSFIFYLNVNSHYNYTPDDAFIYFQYAKNILSGNGISFNAGIPSYGFTSPLWLLIITLSGKTGFDIYHAAKYLDIFFALCALVVFYLLALQILRDKVVAIISLIAFSMNAWLVRWTGSGMETSLGVFLVLLTFFFFIRRKYLLSSLFTGILTLVRPECSLFMLIIIWFIIQTKGSNAVILKSIFMNISVFLLTVVPWTIYARIVFGSFMPNTMLGKVGFNFSFKESYSTLVDTLQTIAVTDGIAIVVLLVFGLQFLIKKLKSVHLNNGYESDGNLTDSSIVFYWSILVIAFYVITDANVVSRYLLVVTPMILMYSFYFLREFLKTLSRKVFLYTGIIILMVSVVIQNQIFYSRIVKPGIDAFSFGMETCLIPIGKWLKQNTDQKSTIITADIGAIGYYSDRKVFDAAGLASPEFLSLLHSGLLPYEIIEERKYEAFCKPNYIIHRSAQYEQLSVNNAFVPLVTKSFYRMGLNNKVITYYTIYSVKNP